MSRWERPGASDEWLTPKYVFDALGAEFDLDPAAPFTGGHVPCRKWFHRNGLETPWGDDAFIWLNPPFGGRNGILPWLRKFVEHGGARHDRGGGGICLTPDRTSAPWFQWAAARVDRILFASPKIKFERPDGSIGKSPGTGTALMALGQKGIDALVNARNAGLGLLTEPLGVRTSEQIQEWLETYQNQYVPGGRGR